LPINHHGCLWKNNTPLAAFFLLFENVGRAMAFVPFSSLRKFQRTAAVIYMDEEKSDRMGPSDLFEDDR
jgi:hypothetical protein